MIISNRNERRSIKIGLHDELYLITDIFKRLTETYYNTDPKIINPSYYSKLNKSMDCYNHHRLRMFLFRYPTRKEINEFYRSLQEFMIDNEKNIVTLNKEGLPEKHKELIPKINALKEKAVGILPKISVWRRTHKE